MKDNFSTEKFFDQENFRRNVSWQSLPSERKACDDIAKQLFKKSEDISVIMGGGGKYFTPADDGDYPAGQRLDGENFLKQWRENPRTRLVQTEDEMFAYLNDGMPEERLVGIYGDSHLEFEVDRANPNIDLGKSQPHLGIFYLTECQHNIHETLRIFSKTKRKPL